jgi:hypothetical protein
MNIRKFEHKRATFLHFWFSRLLWKHRNIFIIGFIRIIFFEQNVKSWYMINIGQDLEPDPDENRPDPRHVQDRVNLL